MFGKLRSIQRCTVDLPIMIRPAEWSRWNVSLRLAVAPAWPAEPVGVAQPATRRRRAGTPLVLVACSRARHAAPPAFDDDLSSDNGPEFVAEAVQAWITAVGAK